MGLNSARSFSKGNGGRAAGDAHEYLAAVLPRLKNLKKLNALFVVTDT
jgi:hypothetical protein